MARHKPIDMLARLQDDTAQLRDWLKANPNHRNGAKGSIHKSNRTRTQFS